MPGWALGRPPQGRERRGWLDQGGELASSSGSRLRSGAGNLPEKGMFSLALQKSRSAWAPLLGLEAVTGRNGSSSLRPRGLAPRCRGSCGWEVEGPPREPQASPSRLLVGVKWLACLAPAPLLPRSEHRPLITPGRRYRQSLSRRLLHADGWQPAPCDKLIRPNPSPLSTAPASDFPPPAFLHQPPAPMEPGACLAPSWGPGAAGHQSSHSQCAPHCSQGRVPP